MADTNPTNNDNLKPYAITNIKDFVPLVLDLNQLNYDAWRILFTTHCKAYGVYGHLDGTSAPTEATQAEWTKLDNLVCMWIYDNKDTRAIDLEDELRTMTLGDRSVTDLCTKMTQIYDLLANIGSPVAEKTLVTYFLNAIHPRFDNVATIIRHSDPIPSFLKVRSMLTLEERKTHRDIPTLAAHNDHSSSPTVLHTGSPAPSRDQRSNRNNNNRRQSSRDNRRQPPAEQ
ncbi:hypothetical protein OSB04_002485 [Centaurea solstitialis]|uniref:Gag protein n=1 Tax=Centaurea solstitialis TaxID=347529 RepID=A0AA38TTG9_9ASTR|nr:hypothetical protein OSB04_002485 [Centaurea solstitialis]